MNETFCGETFNEGNVLCGNISLRKRFVEKHFMNETFCEKTFHGGNVLWGNI